MSGSKEREGVVFNPKLHVNGKFVRKKHGKGSVQQQNGLPQSEDIFCNGNGNEDDISHSDVESNIVTSSDDEYSVEDDDLGSMFPNLKENDGKVASKRKLSDENVDNGLTICEEDSNLSEKRKRKIKKVNDLKKLHKPPTVEELNRLRETENLFHSNLFRRQIEEMLSELELKDTYKVRVNSWFEKFNDWLSKMEDESEKYQLSDKDWLKTLKIPLHFQQPMKGTYQFKKPLRAMIIGSYVSKTMLGPGNIDILIEVPSTFFQKEDNLNGRYHLKRAIYLSEIAGHFQIMDDLVQKVQYIIADGDAWNPLLEITPTGKLAKKTVFTIHLAPEKSTFKFTRFLPSKNNIRSRWFFGKEAESFDESVMDPTPLYNSSILRDLKMIDNLEYGKEIIDKSNQLRDGIILLKVWLKQRDLHLGHGGFNGFISTMLVCYLLQIRKINLTMSSYQVIRCVWNFLSTTDWSKNGLTLSNAGSSENHPSLSEFHDNFPLVFVDPSGLLNLCAGVSLAVYQRCKDEAKLAMTYLDKTDLNSFQFLFMTPVPFLLTCDHMIVVRNLNKFKDYIEKQTPLSAQLNNYGQLHPQIRDILLKLLEKGLTQRARKIYVKQNAPHKVSLGKQIANKSEITFGLILDPDHCFSMVDKGPVGNNAEANEFREFWKGRSELRRFQDGSITEAVVWKAKTWEDKRMISRLIVKFLLEDVIGLDGDSYHYVADQLQSFLPVDWETRTSQVLKDYEELATIFRDSTSLPLDIISIQGASGVFRHSDPFPPTIPEECISKAESRKQASTSQYAELVESFRNKCPPFCATATILIHLSSSNKWPNDLTAMRMLIANFNIDIAKLLREEHKMNAQPYHDRIVVMTKSTVFNLSIVHPSELILMKTVVENDGLVKMVDTRETFEWELKNMYWSKITSVLNGIHSQHSSFGPACCIAKRWVRAHLLDEFYLSDEAIDLLMASVYLNPQPWEPPNQPQLAFMRFLHLIANTNWHLDFILLNFNDELQKEEINGIRSFFDANRETVPPLFIATPYDREKSVFTKDGPCPVVLHRLSALCLQACTLLTNIYTKSGLDVQSFFTPSTELFDVVIEISDHFNTKKKLQTTIPAEKRVNKRRKIPVINFDPVNYYLRELRASYSENALFFHDSCGGSTIAVAWKPGYDTPSPIKIAKLNARSVLANQLYFHVEALLDACHRFSPFMVKKVKYKKDGAWLEFSC